MTEKDGPSASEVARQLKIYEALVAGIERRHEVLDAVFDSADPFDAMDAVGRLLNVEQEPASAVIEMQFRGLVGDTRSRLMDRLEELRAQSS